MKLFRIVTALLLLTVAAWAQTETGQITGVVTDTTGAVIVGVQVTATDVDRQVTRSTETNASGNYAITHLRPGNYKVTFVKTGFAQFARTIVLNVGTTFGMDAQLGIGSASETVEVSAGAAAVEVNTQNQTLQQVITEKQVTELPSLTRNPYDLVATAGNITPDVEGRGVGYSINGQRAASTSILLDGTDNVWLFYAQTGQSVPMDSVQEFSVLTSGFTAEFGRASGGVVNVSTKSGTNNFHGSAYEFNRISALASNSYQNAFTQWDAINRGVCAGPSDRSCPGRKGTFTRNQFGYSIGGPILKNKLFFFHNLEWLRIRSANSRQRWVLTPEFISALPANAQQFMSIGTLKSDMIKTDVYTAAQLSAAVKASATNAPVFFAWATANPNVPVFQGVNWTTPNNAGGGTPQNDRNMVNRVDLNISDRTQFYARMGIDKYVSLGSGAPTPYAGYDYFAGEQDQSWLVSLVHSFSNNLVTQSKFAFNRLNNNTPLGTNPPGPTLYMNSSSVPSFGGKRLDFPGYLPEGPGTGIPAGGPQNVYALYEDLTWVKGAHTMRFGFQGIHTRDNRMFGAYMNNVEDLSSSGNNALAFNNLMKGVLYDFVAAVDPQGKYPCKKTMDPVTGALTTVKDDSCKVVLPLSFPRFTRNNRYNDMSLYAQDAWKVTPRFTLNYGVRWEYYGVQHNVDPKLDSNFYLGSGANIFEKVRNGNVMLTHDSPVGGLWGKRYNGFGPRLGFAWDVFGDGKTALRGGYSISFERNFGNVTYNVIQNPPNYGTLNLTEKDVGAPIPITTVNGGPLGGTGSAYLPTVQLRNPRQDMHMAYAETWNLSVDREIAKDTVFSAAYSGSHGVHLYSITNLNRTGFGQFYLGDPSFSTRLNNQYSNLNQRGDDGFSHYNGLNLSVRTNNFKNSGVTMTANYTWSHAIDNTSTTFSGGTNVQLGLLDPFMPALDKGNAEFDVRHRLTVSAIWNLPFFNNSSNKFLKNIVGGWELIPQFTARTGEPFTIIDCSMAYTYCPRYMPVTGPVNGGSNTTVTSLYNPATGTDINSFSYIQLPTDAAGDVQGVGAYTSPVNGYSDFPVCTGLGTGCSWPTNMTQRDAYRGPGNWNTDLALYKNIKATERFTIQIRGEMYNLFNHKNLYVDTGTLDISSDPVVKAYKDDYRNVQLGIRFTF